jgi:hypothetical protein
MSTIINNPPERVIEIERTDSSGLIALVLILAVAIIGAGWFYMNHRGAPAEAPSNGGANINITLPTSPSENEGGQEQSPAY